jgi:hypothetical protein
VIRGSKQTVVIRFGTVSQFHKVYKHLGKVTACRFLGHSGSAT